MFRSKLPFVAFATTVLMAFAGCSGGHGTSAPPIRADAGAARMQAEINRIAMENAKIPHGAEIESGTPMTIKDGNVQMLIPPSASVTRTTDAIVVTYNGHTRRYSPDAVITVGGDFHRFAPITK